MGILENEIDRLRLRCIACGRCTRVCPSMKHGGCDPMEIMTGIDEGIEFCISCGNCSKACRRTDPFTVMRDLICLSKGLHVSDSFRETGYSMPITPMDCPGPEWEGGDIDVMAGCVVRCKVPFIENAAAQAMKAMGIGAKALEDNRCCLHPVQFRDMSERERMDVKSEIGKSSDGKPIVTLCGGCSEELQAADIGAEHIIPFLHRNMDSLPKTDHPLKVALQPGCSAMPFKKQMDEVVRAMGYEPIGNQMGCCGKNVSVSKPLMEERMEECARADLVVVGCPMCFVKYDSQPNGKPVVHIAELVAMAAGNRDSLEFHKIQVPWPTSLS